MRTVFFDTETTGKPKRYNALITDLDNWPRLVQLAYLIHEDGKEIYQRNVIIRPNGFEIPVDATAIHGISQAEALEVGVDLIPELDEFLNHISNSDIIVGHNISFDMNIIGSEVIRAGRKLPARPCVCTMKSSTDFCKLPGTRFGQYKWPKLQELHKKLFNEEFSGAHDAFSDINATARCFYELTRLGVI